MIRESAYNQEDICREIREAVMATGAVAVGFAEAGEIDADVAAQYDRWIASGAAGGMDYLVRHAPLRRHPRHVLENVRGVVSIAYSYAPAEWRSAALPQIACYAYGQDYHDVLRKRLQPVVEQLKERLGGEWRVCIDSAPLAERYWAVKSGIGRIGKNGSVIVDNFGSYVFLVEILTTLPVASEKLSAPSSAIGCEPPSPLSFSSEDSSFRDSSFGDSSLGDSSLRDSSLGDSSLRDSSSEDSSSPSEIRFNHVGDSVKRCKGCDACVRACPQGALKGDGTMDARRCLNYLTIEHRGDWEGESLEAMQTAAGVRTLYGCDICQRVCPHNRDVAPTTIAEFAPTPFLLALDKGGALSLDQSSFSSQFKGSPIKRAKLAGLLRNARNLK